MLKVKLEELLLKNNNLKSLNVSLIRLSQTLTTVDLRNNKLTKIKSETFSLLRKVTELKLSGIDITATDLRNSGILSMSNLAELDVSHNRLIGRSFEEIKMMLRNLTNIERLYLSHCSIKNLPPYMFHYNQKLNYLDLISNEINFLNATSFINATALETLMLIGNQISFVTFDSFVNLPALRELQLSNNPLLCTCEVLFILQAVRTNSLFMGSMGLRGMQCRAPEKVRGQTLAQLRMELTDCEEPWIDVLIPIGGPCGSLFLAVLIFVVLRYRWHLKYVWFLAKTGIRRYHEMQDESHYEYDAFVAYSEKDLWWVKEHLLPNLEADYKDQGGLRICIHHRDWLAGIDIVDNIVTSIEKSRRTIIVLSDNFAKSQWCQYELAMAQLRLDADGTCRELLVLVLLSNISGENLTPRLRFLLTTKTYLSWSEEPDGQALFWRGLHRRLLKPARAHVHNID
jgi:hypothetical protein